ncbi:MAG: polyphosphate--glucose phosphotransferase, partial [Caldilineaceae bacterium]
MQALGIDIGGSGVKGSVVDLARGELLGERVRFDTPLASTPAAVAPLVAAIVKQLKWTGPVGCTFPGIIYHGVIKTAANLDKAWVDTDGVRLFERVTGRPVKLINDADAAGIAEMSYGAGRNQAGVTIMLTFGTGIGSAVFLDGKLLPNTEFGHLPIRGKAAEHRAAARIRKEEGLSWEEWAERVNEYLALLEFFFSPDLFIIGGGVSKKYDRFMHLLRTRALIVPAQLLNDAGIMGAAMYVADLARPDDDQPGQSLEQAGLIPSDAAMSGPGNTARLSMPFEIEASHAEDG